ncbi:MAG: thioredoxin family protein, partial [Bacteroidales bacterium]|nr:thioredoxin family protein [Bacteroidales bacterium]
MTKKITIALLAVLLAAAAYGQAGMKKVYDEEINVNQQIDKALSQAKSAGKFVVCQVGGNWCPWCLRFADFITKDADISKLIADNFVYIHVNYNPRAD